VVIDITLHFEGSDVWHFSSSILYNEENFSLRTKLCIEYIDLNEDIFTATILEHYEEMKRERDDIKKNIQFSL
jgi:hypothetical protein